MACWSAENATKAYLSTLKMGQKAKEPDVAEFISALAAGNNAQLMVVACASAADSTTLALVAAANQTGGHVICIVPGLEELHASQEFLGTDSVQVHFVIGEPQELLLTRYPESDFVLINCNLQNHEGILRAVEASRKRNGTVVVGYNAFCKGSCWSCGSRTQLLPIGGGLLVTKFAANARIPINNGCGIIKRSHWVVKVDKCTGEEHVFRVRFPQGKVIQS
ncbi:S-adenosyl-L-methionine-dependent methyltransferase [Quillaja saponaria]|uniref:S-adenosyl-L-methionine-dependent methyltransferase n=1 Tax=Quillaja saponaria TaxID=32244 RepID=A0AAD7VH85_QUISA|nr:S-adenosyl-L-methionine-dependent methyltransferase [Quillaja saponaria]